MLKETEISKNFTTKLFRHELIYFKWVFLQPTLHICIACMYNQPLYLRFPEQANKNLRIK